MTQITAALAAWKVMVASDRQGFKILATVPIAAGESILLLDGLEVDRPTRYSVQVDEFVHIDSRPAVWPVPAGAEPEPCFWQYLNHSCRPNALVRGRALIAYVAIKRGEEVTFNYNSSEYDMASPFACRCGEVCCTGVIRGFRHLSEAQRAALQPLLAEHVLRLASRPTNRLDPFEAKPRSRTNRQRKMMK